MTLICPMALTDVNKNLYTSSEFDRHVAYTDNGRSDCLYCFLHQTLRLHNVYAIFVRDDFARYKADIKHRGHVPILTILHSTLIKYTTLQCLSSNNLSSVAAMLGTHDTVIGVQ